MPKKTKYITFEQQQKLNEKTGFIQVNHLILKLINTIPDIKLAERSLLTYLYIEACNSRYHFDSSSLPRTNKSIRKIADDLNLSVGYASELRNSLVDKGLIATESESISKGTTIVLLLPSDVLKQIQNERFKQKAINKKIVEEKEKLKLQSNETSHSDINELQLQVVEQIASLNHKRIALQSKLIACSSKESKDIKQQLRSVKYRLGQLNDKLFQLQKHGVNKRMSALEQELHEQSLKAERPIVKTNDLSPFVTPVQTKELIEALKAQGVSPPMEYAKQVLWSIRYGYYSKRKYTAKHAIASALVRIKENTWFVSSDYDPTKVEGLLKFHVSKAKPEPVKYIKGGM